MEPILIALLAAVAVLLLLVLIKLFSPSGAVSRQISDLKNEITELKTTGLQSQARALEALNDHMVKSQGTINTQLAGTQRVIAEVHQRLGSLSEATRNIQEIGKDISSLQSILQAPKLRGNLGEYLLEDLLKQILPGENYRMKHSFRNGTQVDAVIRLAGSVISIDSKFPLESFQRMSAADSAADKARFKKEFVRTVKARIDEIASKYINPDEGTFDFALMYIPAENVFYEMIVTDEVTDKSYEIFHYAVQRHVIPVSPNSFYSYLMAIAYGLRGFRVEQQAKTIIGELAKVRGLVLRLYGGFHSSGQAPQERRGKFDDCQRKVERFSDRVSRITGAALEPGEDAPKLSQD